VTHKYDRVTRILSLETPKSGLTGPSGQGSGPPGTVGFETRYVLSVHPVDSDKNPFKS